MAARLADAAGAALEASLCVARTRVSSGAAGAGLFPREQVARTRLAVIGMGKTGARELNYVSDVDVIFVAGARRDALEALGESARRRHRDAPGRPDDARHLEHRDRAAAVGGRREPAPGGQAGRPGPHARLAPVVLRPLGEELGVPGAAEGPPDRRRCRARRRLRRAPCSRRSGRARHARTSSTACSGCASASPSTSRPADVPYQLKLGPGGIRDIEFTVQLLQLVHGLSDDRIRQRGTLEALDALVDRGLHRPSRGGRLLARLPRAAAARASRAAAQPAPHAPDAVAPRGAARARPIEPARRHRRAGLESWESVKREVRDIHVRLFYRPLLSAVAALPAEERVLSTEQAHDRLAAIGFADPAGALRHIAALTSGLSRKATIQRHLMPVMIRWFADGVDPDYGLLAFRRLSERLGRHALVPPDAARLVRRGREADAGAVGLALRRRAHGVDPRVGRVARRPGRCSGRGPAWRCRKRRAPSRRVTPRSRTRCARCGRSAAGSCCAWRWRRSSARSRSRRWRESLTTITEVTIQATLRAVRRDVVPPEDAALDFSVIAMGRFGGRRARVRIRRRRHVRLSSQRRRPAARPRTRRCSSSRALRKHSEDHRVPLDLDADLRPEGRNGPLARSLDAYAEYYRRWSLSWEAQALLRARGVAGSVKLIRAFTALADEVRYPAPSIRRGCARSSASRRASRASACRRARIRRVT